MIRCGSCGEENPPRARFCLACAAPLGTEDAARETRRIVTVLFADLVGSTTIGERLDPETFRSIQTRYFAALRSAIESHGGTVEKYIGDAVMAVFGLPTLHEDDALRAVRAAIAFAPALEALNAELTPRHGVSLQLRVGLHSGEVVAADASARQAMVSGDTVNTAARLEAAARPGEILLGPLTFELVRDAVSADAIHGVTLRGRDEILTAYRLLAVTGTESRIRRLDRPLIGRIEELEALRAAFDRAAAGPGELVTIIAPAGTGKSRLVREFLATAEAGATILRGRCLNYGDGITYWALGEILRAAAGIEETDDPDAVRAGVDALVGSDAEASRIAGILASVIGVSPEPASGEDVTWAVRRVLTNLAADHLLVVVVEDIHWAEPALLDLLEVIVDWSRDSSILLLCLARPELLEARPEWGADRSYATTLRLEPLDATDAAALVGALPGGRALPGPLRARILGAAEGNPLFVEEFLAMLVDDGRLTQAADGSWAAAPDIEDVSVPRSISLLIAARLDSLDAGDRGVAQRGSVVGRVFERRAIAELSPEPSRESLDMCLESLTQRQVILHDAAGQDGDDTYRFRHVLIRDAAYEALTKTERADLHERFARWLMRAASERRMEYVEIIAHHFAQAADYLHELGTLSERPDLASEAIETLIAAADRSEQVHALAETVRLLQRALALDEHGSGAVRIDRISLLERAAESARLGQEPDAARQLGSEALVAAATHPDPATMARLSINAAGYARDVGDDGGLDRHLAEAERFVGAISDSRDRAVVMTRLGRILMLAGRLSQSESVCREAIATPGLDDTTLASAEITLGTALYWQQRFTEIEEPFAAGRAHAEAADSEIEILRWYNNYAIALEELEGPDAAAELCAEGRAVARRYGMERTSFGIALALNAIANATEWGRAAEVEATAREYLEAGLSGRESVWASTMLGYALIHRSRFDEARVAFDAGRRLAKRWPSSEDVGDLAESQAVLCVWTGEPDRAVPLVSEAIEVLPTSQAWLIQRAIAVGLRADGDIAERCRSTGDEAGLAGILVAASALNDRARAVAESVGDDTVFGRRGEACKALIDAELTRIAGASDPASWAVAVERLRGVNWRSHAAYAGWQAARARCAAGTDGASIREAILDALSDGDASEPARRALLALAEEQGIDLAFAASA